MLKKDLSKFKNEFAEYTELRVQENRNINITLVNGDVMGNQSSVSSGISARVNKNGNWGFASNPVISDIEIEKVILSATENANFLGTKQSRGKVTFQKRIHKSENEFYAKGEIKGQSEKIAFLKKIDSYISEKYPDLLSRTIVLSALDMEKNLITSDGTESYSMIPKAHIYVILSKQSEGENFELYKVLGGSGQFEDVFKKPEDLFADIDECYKNLIDKTKGVHANSGMKDVILDAKLAGILAHEAIGHTTEADFVLSGSVAADYLDQQVASPLISLVDFANTYNGETCPVPVYVDDEGTKAEDQVIIDKGVLKGYMHNKESALQLGQNITGNARAYSFADEPIIRMRNTVILPGKSKLADMIASIEDGYYLVQSSNGQADSTSEFMFGITLGYEIRNGKIGKAIKDTTISGIAFDVLKSVTMVSDDMVWDCSGMCGKKQSIPVGMGGPAVKCKVNIGGR
ncbi:MAG TPA: TldD/PmbA family protein [Clostridiales bacterium]|nr:TldD/PmbA family protein [Clostridiales bacterium]HQP69434.1 TldD/PmbA family protein [Clostridiales bacterium]